MSTVTSFSLLGGVTAPRPASCSGGWLQSARPAAVAPLSFQKKSRPLSVCCVNNPKMEHNPTVHPFDIPPVALVNLVPPRGERWQLEEKDGEVKLWFEVPGQSKDNVAVEIDEDVLVIKKKTNVGGGVRRNTNATGAGGIQAGTGEEAVPEGDVILARLLLPAGYSKESVKAELKSGELTVSIAKIKQQARRKINVDIIDVK